MKKILFIILGSIIGFGILLKLLLFIPTSEFFLIKLTYNIMNKDTKIETAISVDNKYTIIEVRGKSYPDGTSACAGCGGTNLHLNSLQPICTKSPGWGINCKDSKIKSLLEQYNTNKQNYGFDDSHIIKNIN
jgi:hypothetical protein